MRDAFNALMPYPPVTVARGAGSLDGLRLAVKDLFDVAGYRTGCGNPVKLAESPVAAAHAPAVACLLAAGAEFVGKAQTDELAWSLIGRNPHFGPVTNPAALDRIAGGSSCGSAAAVAGGLADIALGTDTGGSVRAPASFCGLWGLRPTWGRAPLDRCMPLVPSFDTVGLFARDGATLLRAATVLLGPDPEPLRADGPPPLAADMMARVAPEARAALGPVAARLSAGSLSLYPDDPEALHACFDILQSREVLATQGPWIDAADPPLGEMIRPRLAAARAVPAAAEPAARADRKRFAGAIVAALAGRAVLAPAVHDAPIRADAGTAAHMAFAAAARRLLCVAGLAGLPQVVMPAVRVGGAPVGLSLIGPPGTDLALIAAAVALLERPMMEV